MTVTSCKEKTMNSKLILTFILLLGLSACKVTPTPTEEPLPTETFTPEPAQVDVVPEEENEEPTETFTPEPEVNTAEETLLCTELLTPEDGADLPANGKVIFSWNAHPDADTYSLNFIFPDGLELNFTTDEPTTHRYMDGFSMHPA